MQNATFWNAMIATLVAASTACVLWEYGASSVPLSSRDGAPMASRSLNTQNQAPIMVPVGYSVTAIQP
jgi:hypothetical protein